MKKMNIGLVGAGFMGKAHMVAFSNMPKLFTDAPFIPVFKTVCDIVPEIAEDFKERYGFAKACTNGKGNCSVSAHEKVKFTSNKLTDTFYYYGRLSVTADGATTDINLKRAVGAFKVHITDENIPEEIRSIKFYYTGGSSTLDATTGFGCVNSRQTENFSMKDGGRDFTVYTFPHEEEKNIKMSISFLDADAKVVKSFEKADLKIHQNKTAYTEISIADGFGGGDDSTGGGIGITVDPTWGETERVNF